MAAAVRFGVRPCRGAKQTEADNPVIDRNTVFAVVQESCPTGGIPQRGPGMGTDFKTVGIILTGTMGGTGKIAELDLMIRLIGIDSRVESNLQQTVAFLPVGFSDKFKLFLFGGQADPLGNNRRGKTGGNLQFSKNAAGADDFRCTDRIRRNFPVLCPAVQVPGVKTAGEITVQMENVGAGTDPFSAVLQLTRKRSVYTSPAFSPEMHSNTMPSSYQCRR